mgnify:FL=1|jgi:5'-3' exonuclease
MSVDFEKWFNNQGKSVKDSLDDLTIYESPKNKPMLTEAQITVLKEYPEVSEANDLPFDVQEEIISLNEWDNATCTDGNLQGEVDAFLANQYSLVTRNLIH